MSTENHHWLFKFGLIIGVSLSFVCFSSFLSAPKKPSNRESGDDGNHNEHGDDDGGWHTAGGSTAAMSHQPAKKGGVSADVLHELFARTRALFSEDRFKLIGQATVTFYFFGDDPPYSGATAVAHHLCRSGIRHLRVVINRNTLGSTSSVYTDRWFQQISAELHAIVPSVQCSLVPFDGADVESSASAGGAATEQFQVLFVDYQSLVVDDGGDDEKLGTGDTSVSGCSTSCRLLLKVLDANDGPRRRLLYVSSGTTDAVDPTRIRLFPVINQSMPPDDTLWQQRTAPQRSLKANAITRLKQLILQQRQGAPPVSIVWGADCPMSAPDRQVTGQAALAGHAAAHVLKEITNME